MILILLHAVPGLLCKYVKEFMAFFSEIQFNIIYYNGRNYKMTELVGRKI